MNLKNNPNLNVYACEWVWMTNLDLQTMASVLSSFRTAYVKLFFSCHIFSIVKATNLCYFSIGLYFCMLSLSTFLLDGSLSNVVISLTAKIDQTKLIWKTLVPRSQEAVKTF